MSAHVRERLSAYLDHEVDVDGRAAIEAHLATCPECSEWLTRLALVDSALAELPPPETTSDEVFAAQVRARIEAEGPRVARRGPAAAPRRRPSARLVLPTWTWAAAAAFLFAVVTPLTLREWRHQRQRPLLQATAPESAARTARPASAAEPAPGSGYVPPPPRPASAPAKGPATREATRLLGSDDRRDSAGAPPRTPTTTTVSEIRLEAEALPSPPEAGAGEGRAGGGAPSGVVGGVVSRPAETSSRAAAPRLAPPPPQREVARERKGEAPEHEARLAQRFRAKAAPAPGGPPKAAAVPGVAQPPSDAFADKGGPAEESAAFIRLAAEHPEAAEDWRRLRQAWRELAPTLGSRELADEARVRGLEAAAGAFRTSGEAQDAAVLQSDAAEYFSRADALQSDRVRRLLRQVLP